VKSLEAKAAIIINAIQEQISGIENISHISGNNFGKAVSNSLVRGKPVG